MDLPKEQKKKFLQNVDLDNTDFQVKIADFGLSKSIPKKESKM